MKFLKYIYGINLVYENGVWWAFIDLDINTYFDFKSPSESWKSKMAASKTNYIIIIITFELSKMITIMIVMITILFNVNSTFGIKPIFNMVNECMCNVWLESISEHSFTWSLDLGPEYSPKVPKLVFHKTSQRLTDTDLVVITKSLNISKCVRV